MKLQKDILRIQSLLVENLKDSIRGMMDKHGLFHTIRLFGNYEEVLKHFDHEGLTNQQKIKFIKESVEFLSHKYNNTDGVSIYDLGINPIPYDYTNTEIKQIEYFGINYLYIDVYDSEMYMLHLKDYKMIYEDLDDDTLDNVCIFMIDALEYNI